MRDWLDTHTAAIWSGALIANISPDRAIALVAGVTTILYTLLRAAKLLRDWKRKDTDHD